MNPKDVPMYKRLKRLVRMRGFDVGMNTLKLFRAMKTLENAHLGELEIVLACMETGRLSQIAAKASTLISGKLLGLSKRGIDSGIASGPEPELKYELKSFPVDNDSPKSKTKAIAVLLKLDGCTVADIVSITLYHNNVYGTYTVWYRKEVR